MSLPPLANFVAVRRHRPPDLDAVERRLRGDARFRDVFRPAPGWVVGSAPLPGGEPEPPGVRAAGLVFGEGRATSGAVTERGSADMARQAAERPGTLAEAPGDFTFAAFRPDGGVTVVRSAGGLVPVYVHESGSAFATRLSLLLPFLDAVELDPLPIAMWGAGAGAFPWSRTFLRGVRLLGRGRYARVSTGDGAVEDGQYWDPRPERLRAPTPEAFREHAERLRTILLDRLAADLDPSGGNLLSLSGGVDSASLLCLAAGTLGLPVAAMSFLPAEPGPLAVEMGYIESAAARGPLVRHWPIHIGPDGRLGRFAGDSPAPGFPVLHPVLLVLPEIAREFEVRVLFGGEFGDELGGAHAALMDWVFATPLGRLLAHPSRLPNGPQDVVRWIKWRWERSRGRPRLLFPSALPEWLHPDVRAEYREWIAWLGARALADPRPHPHLAIRTELDAFLPMNWEACSELGVRRSVPFFNRAALELAFETHPAERVEGGLRRLIRAALAADVPARNLARRDRGQWGRGPIPRVAWTEPLPAELEPVVSPGWFPRPPAELDLASSFGLKTMTRFVRSVDQRRAALQAP